MTDTNKTARYAANWRDERNSAAFTLLERIFPHSSLHS